MIAEFLEIKPLVNINIIKETLERMGIANRENRILYPSCYIYENGKTYLAHFKQMIGVLNKNSYNNISQLDITRRNAIARCLKTWKMIDLDDKLVEDSNVFIFILPFKEKKAWVISHKIKIVS